MTDPREEAIRDCKYAKSLGDHALSEHIGHWLTGATTNDSDAEYQKTIQEISVFLDTPVCLLKDSK